MKKILLFLFLGTFIILNAEETLFDKGLAEYELKNYQRAIDFFTAYLKRNKSTNTYYNRGLAYHRLEKYTHALEDYTIVIDKDPLDDLAWYNRGLVYFDLEEYKKAFYDSRKAVELNPELTSAYTIIGLYYFKNKNYLQALESFNTAIKIKENSVLYYNRGLVYQELKENEKAEQDFTRAINLEENIDYYWARANIAIQKEQYKIAIEDYGSAIYLDSNFSSLYYNRGLAYYADYQDMNALRDFQKAEKKDTNNIGAKWHLALLNNTHKNYYEALKYYNKVEKQNPNYAFLNELNKNDLKRKTNLGENLMYYIALGVLGLLTIFFLLNLFKREN